MWTKNTIDISIFHEYKDNSNIYSNSYIKEYLEKVVKVKMQVSSIGLPWLKNKSTDIIDEGIASQYSNTEAKKTALKWKKITDYTKDVRASYKALRNIKINIYADIHYPLISRLGTQSPNLSTDTYGIKEDGDIYSYTTTYDALGLRPVITK